jgi:hypothetical protein
MLTRSEIRYEIVVSHRSVNKCNWTEFNADTKNTHPTTVSFTGAIWSSTRSY